MVTSYTFITDRFYCYTTDDWKADQYRWFQNGIKKIPAADPVFKKKYYVTVTPKGKDSTFVREAYFPWTKNKTLFSSITWVIIQRLCSFLMEMLKVIRSHLLEHAHQ